VWLSSIASVGSAQRFLRKHGHSALVRYAFPFASAALALKLTLMLPNVPTHTFFTFFVAACAASTYVGGARAGVLCVLVSAVVANYYTVVPVGGFVFSHREDMVRFVAFVATALFICWLIARLQSTLGALQREKNASRLSKRRLEYVERHAKVWTWEYDLTAGRVRWSSLCGDVVSRHEQPYEQWLQMVHREDRERVRHAIQDGLAKGEFEAEFRMLGDLQPHWLIGKAQLVLVDAKPAALVGINIDLSLRAPHRSFAHA
jgi:K+-sensing histidine kinase KdpD